jgi:uncharacterized phage-associated protein
MFSQDRVTQMAAYLLTKNGGRMAYIKLMKLLYLAERQAMKKWGESISGDHFVSMPHGPVLSQTYDLIKGHSNGAGCGLWQQWIKDERNYEVALSNTIELDDLDELSPTELNILDATYNQYGHMSRFEIVDYTHDNCPEWQDPKGSSYPIKPQSIYRAMGMSENQVQKMVERHYEQQQLDHVKQQLI